MYVVNYTIYSRINLVPILPFPAIEFMRGCPDLVQEDPVHITMLSYFIY